MVLSHKNFGRILYPGVKRVFDEKMTHWPSAWRDHSPHLYPIPFRFHRDMTMGLLFAWAAFQRPSEPLPHADAYRVALEQTLLPKLMSETHD